VFCDSPELVTAIAAADHHARPASTEMLCIQANSLSLERRGEPVGHDLKCRVSREERTWVGTPAKSQFNPV
jgi:hypothetical protein